MFKCSILKQQNHAWIKQLRALVGWEAEDMTALTKTDTAMRGVFRSTVLLFWSNQIGAHFFTFTVRTFQINTSALISYRMSHVTSADGRKTVWGSWRNVIIGLILQRRVCVIDAFLSDVSYLLTDFSDFTGDEWDYIMSEVQGTLEFSVELHKFHNVDLFQRG